MTQLYGEHANDLLYRVTPDILLYRLFTRTDSFIRAVFLSSTSFPNWPQLTQLCPAISQPHREQPGSTSPRSTTSWDVAKFAASSRALILLLQFLFNYFIQDYNADAFRSPLIILESKRWSLSDRVVHTLLEGLTRWDSQYFLHIAQFGYTYEHMTAFFPGYPYLARILAQAFEDVLGDILSPSSWVLISCVLVTHVSFVLSAVALFYLTQLMFDDRHLPMQVVKMYSFNPASIFFASCYTESLFAFVTFSGLYLLEKEYDTLATVMFAIGSVTRSNASLVPIFYLEKAWRRYQRGKYAFSLLIRAGFACLGNVIVQLYFWDSFCFPHQQPKAVKEVRLYAAEMGYKQIGINASEWCFYRLPFSYSFVQAKYWNVGFFKYWQLKQTPNFLLALPVIVFVAHFCRLYYKRLASYCLHAAILSAICVFFANIQVATRILISASPVPLWAAAKSEKRNLVWAYFLLYFILGLILHTNFFPWT
ncbi:GPI mannosyltransferase 2-like isoform X2 [Varroa jacobsoni]|uniref:GPI mannosyltransferase 2-like isoform X2 n=1 Tax=Varroa jacobsoni TaxID=62625 RepID=UPI000BF658CB|nr:GPI mannosyltransferase 2-like isoform X2 [Varroa jacobsoni]